MAFTVLRLIRFNQNPGEKYYKTIDWALNYLNLIVNYTLQFRGGDTFKTYSNLLFIDNTLDRKSFYRFLLIIYRGVVA